ncbi:MAG TPA: peptide-methionine (R)-S-oxide reductase MsrB [Candidatus Paceibacterota bacterium]|jgi:peptide-methionine (R)-S-oxide reductase|nr:peptide-methionine (R)-S-oxide reductase MsrB [Candidatus Paceibacterota bacterium]
MEKTEEEWKKELTPDQFRILRQKGTEIPFSGEYDTLFDNGMYKCAACGAELFDSTHKYDSGCGWPAFDQAIPGSVTFTDDNSHGMRRVEVTCSRCGGHLGHVFPDGPKNTTGQRFCINSRSLKFNKSDKKE